MATHILREPQVTVNEVDLTDHVSSVEINDGAEEVDVTASGAANKEMLLGIGDASIVVTFFQDFAEGSVHATLKGLAKSNEPFNVVVQPEEGETTATNPTWTMSSVLPEYKYLAGDIGAASTVDVTFKNASGSEGIVEATE